MEYKVLIAEDERSLRNIVSTYLKGNGFLVDTVNDGEEAIAAIDRNVYDVIVLDIMMPKKNGMEVCRYIREKYDVPVIFLTALSKETDIVDGYEVGADEYVVKPVAMPILMAKINSLIKRYRGLVVENGMIRIDKLKIYPARHMVTIEDKVISLAPKEYDLLLYFIENKNQVLSREQILDNIWGPEYEGYDRAVDTHIKKLRMALGDSNHHITTIIKKGYMWEECKNV